MLKTALILAGIAIAMPVQAAEPKPCRILLTNDDGIDAPGIAAAYRELSTLCETIISAPANNQSAASHAVLNRDGKVVVHKRIVAGTTAYAVEGSPAEAVAVGLLGIGRGKHFDLVVSGINYGENLGLGNLYSGTVNAAMEGALRGVPSIAVSQAMGYKDYDLSARLTRQIAALVLHGKMPTDVVLNINIPAGQLRGVRFTTSGGLTMAVSGFDELPQDADSSIFKLRIAAAPPVEGADDVATYRAGYVTITPLAVDRTAKSEIRTLRRSIGTPTIPLPQP